MKAPRKRHFAVERLSKEGQAIVRKGRAENWTYIQIAAAVKTATGEEIGETSIQRWNQWQNVTEFLAERQRALDTAVELIKAVPDARLIMAMNQALKSHLLQKEEELEQLSAIDLLTQIRQMERLELEHKRVEIAAELAKSDRVRAVAAEKGAEAQIVQADAAQRRIDLLEKKLSTAADKIRDIQRTSKDGKVPVKVLAQIAEDLYGLGSLMTAEEKDAP